MDADAFLAAALRNPVNRAIADELSELALPDAWIVAGCLAQTVPCSYLSALQLIVERALDKSELRLLRLMTKRVGAALPARRENGVVKCEQGPGQYML